MAFRTITYTIRDINGIPVILLNNTPIMGTGVLTVDDARDWLTMSLTDGQISQVVDNYFDRNKPELIMDFTTRSRMVEKF